MNKSTKSRIIVFIAVVCISFHSNKAMFGYHRGLAPWMYSQQAVQAAKKIRSAQAAQEKENEKKEIEMKEIKKISIKPTIASMQAAENNNQ